MEGLAPLERVPVALAVTLTVLLGEGVGEEVLLLLRLPVGEALPVGLPDMLTLSEILGEMLGEAPTLREAVGLLEAAALEVLLPLPVLLGVQVLLAEGEPVEVML